MNLDKYPRPISPQIKPWPLFAAALVIGAALAILISLDPVGAVAACMVGIER